MMAEQGTPPPVPGGRARRKLGPRAALGTVGVAAAILVAGVVALSGLGSHPAPKSAAPATSAPAHAAPSSASAALPAGVAPLTSLLPSDIDPAGQCTTLSPPFPWQMTGLVQALSCSDPGLPGGRIEAFQLDSSANFQAAWQNYNSWRGIGSLSPGPVCPPPAGGAGIVGFHNSFFPPRGGQVLECQSVTGSGGVQPAYTWAYPSEDAFIVALGAPGSSFSALDSWWSGASGPAGSPRPSAS